MAKDVKNDKNLNATGKSARKLNDIGKDLLNSIIQNTYKTDTRNKKEIERITQTVDSILGSEMQEIKSFASEDISTFLLKTLAENKNSKSGNPYKALNDKNFTLEDLFNGEDNNDIFTTFNERYKNEVLLMEDLDTITSQLIELDEAINTTRDAIVTADDLGSVMSRTLDIDTLAQEHEIDEYMNIIKEMEDELNLHQKIKNHIVPKTLKYGKYYVYIIPQSKMFQDFQKDKLKKRKLVFESTETKQMDDALDIVLEEMRLVSVNDEPTKPIGFSKQNKNKDNVEKQELKEYITEFCEGIEINNNEIPLPVLENSDFSLAKEDLMKFSSDFKAAVEKENQKIKEEEANRNVYTSLDGVLGIKQKQAKKDPNELEDFSFVKDCYIKLLDPKRVIPVRMMNYTIGYYYSYDTVDPAVTSKNKKSSNRFTTNFNIQNLTEGTGTKNVLNIIAEKIVKSFDKKYLQTNERFKDAILNALMYHKQYNKTLHFQFIPADYVCEFKINEDENGEGVSMIAKSLFYAKLYLSLLLYSILMYMSKSSDTRIYYVKNSGIDTNYTNKVMELARDIKSKQIKFTDLLSYNSMISKIGAGKEIFMPVGKSGERGIEFDILAGQDIRLQDDLMEMLKQGYINGTGVPSVIMNYINEADYAKTLVMANAKYLSRVLNYQIDFNEGLTRMYRMILRCTTNLPPQVINGVTFKFMVPKSLANTNFADLVQYGDNIIDFIIRYMFGENSEQTEDDNKAKDLVRKKLAKEVLPFLPWEMIEESYKEAMLEAKADSQQKEANQDNENQ